MTPVELATLRDHVARRRLGIADARKQEQAAEDKVFRAGFRDRCVYCGLRLRDPRGRYSRYVGLACPSHDDLPMVDPKFAVAVAA